MNRTARHDDIGITRTDLRHLALLQRQAAGLSLRPRLVRTLAEGPHLSLFKGRGMEFAESRPYQEGDDVRQLDWRVMARTGKPYTRLFREERERPVLLWVDLRSNMHFATRGAFKAVRAAEAAALLAWTAHAGGDRVGAVVSGAGRSDPLRPRRSRSGLLHLLAGIAEHPAWHTYPAPEPALDLGPLHRLARPGSLVVLLSDFRHAPERALERLRLLARRCDLLFVFIYDPFEAALPAAGILPVTDGRHEALIDTGDPARRAAHAEHFRRHRERLARLALHCRAPLVECPTPRPTHDSLRHRLGRHA